MYTLRLGVTERPLLEAAAARRGEHLAEFIRRVSLEAAAAAQGRRSAPADSFRAVAGQLDAAVEELEVLAGQVEGYALEPLRLLRAEVRVSRGRLENCRKALGQ